MAFAPALAFTFFESFMSSPTARKAVSLCTAYVCDLSISINTLSLSYTSSSSSALAFLTPAMSEDMMSCASPEVSDDAFDLSSDSLIMFSTASSYESPNPMSSFMDL